MTRGRRGDRENAPRYPQTLKIHIWPHISASCCLTIAIKLDLTIHLVAVPELLVRSHDPPHQMEFARLETCGQTEPGPKLKCP